jgi:hypothetical protein
MRHDCYDSDGEEIDYDDLTDEQLANCWGPEYVHYRAADREWQAAVDEGRQEEYEAELQAGRAGRCSNCGFPMTEDEATPWHPTTLMSVPDPLLGGHMQNVKWSQLKMFCPECVSECPNRGEPYRGHWYRPHLIEVVNERKKSWGIKEVVPS